MHWDPTLLAGVLGNLLHMVPPGSARVHSVLLHPKLAPESRLVVLRM